MWMIVAIMIMAAGLCLDAAPVRAQQAPETSVGPCFQVIEGQVDMAPAAPMLVNRCNGETFLLTRTRRDGRVAFEWVPISKAAPGAIAAAAAPPSAVAPRAKGSSKDGCFTYNGRSFCP